MDICNADLHRVCRRVLCDRNRPHCAFHFANADRCRNVAPEDIPCCICLMVYYRLRKCGIAQNLNVRIFGIRLHFPAVHAGEQYIAVAFLLKGIEFVVGILTVWHCKAQVIACYLRSVYIRRTIYICPASAAALSEHIQLAAFREIISHRIFSSISLKPCPAYIGQRVFLVIDCYTLLFTVDDQLIPTVNFLIFNDGLGRSAGVYA